MLSKQDVPYAITQITNEGLNTLLNDNINFEIAGFMLLDEEINYNLVNDDQKTTKGFDRVNYYDADNLYDLNSQSIMEPRYRLEEVKDFLFGDPVIHALLPEQIKNEQDLIRDIQAGPIKKTTEIVAAQEERFVEFNSTVLSGDFNPFTLSLADLQSWAVGIDIRGTVTVHQNGQAITLIEAANTFAQLNYIVRFHGDSANKIFEYTQSVAPDEPLQLSTKKLQNSNNIQFALYGTFSVYKSFLFEGKEYTSEIISFVIQPEEHKDQGKYVLDGKKVVLDLYSGPYLKKSVFLKTTSSLPLIPPKVFLDAALSPVDQQKRLNGYFDLSQPVNIIVNSSSVNSFHLILQNIASREQTMFLSVEGAAVGDNFVMAKELVFSFLLYRNLQPDGYYIGIRPNMPDTMGFLVLDESTESYYEYSLLGERRYKFRINFQKAIRIATETHYGNMSEYERLWSIFSPDQDLLVDFDKTRSVLLDDFEHMILEV